MPSSPTNEEYKQVDRIIGEWDGLTPEARRERLEQLTRFGFSAAVVEELRNFHFDSDLFSASALPFPIDTIIEGSTRWKLLGIAKTQGGQGVIYRAHMVDRDDKATVGSTWLIKVLPLITQESREQAITRFRDEMGRLATCTLKVVKIYDSGQREGTDQHLYPWYAMPEHRNAQPLGRFLSGTSWRRTAPHKLLKLFAELCKGLHDAHMRDVIHGDISPGNVLVENEDPILIDFGAACLRHEDRADANPIITSGYAAQEVYTGQPKTERSDIYAVGVLLVQALLGRGPDTFAGQPVDTLVKQVQESLPPAVWKTTDLRQALLPEILEKTLREPGRRYRTADEFAEDLDELASCWRSALKWTPETVASSALPKSNAPAQFSHETQPSRYIRVWTHGIDAFSNLLIRWGLHRRPGTALIKWKGAPSYVCQSLRSLEIEVSNLPGFRFKKRIWGQIAAMVLSEGTADCHLRTWSEQQIFTTSELEDLRSGAAQLGFVVDAFHDFSPGSLQRLTAWIRSLVVAGRTWEPLVFVIHNLPEDSSASIRGIPRDIEHLRISEDPESDENIISSARSTHVLTKKQSLYGVAKLLQFAERQQPISNEEHSALQPVIRWLSTKPDIPEDLAVMDLPFPAAMVVSELESVETTIAQSLVYALSNWLMRFRPSLGPAFVRGMAGSKSKALRIAALEPALATPGLVEAWVDGLESDAKETLMDETSMELPKSLYPMSAAWCRRILRGQQIEAEMFSRWASQHLPTDVARAAVAVIRRDPMLLVQQLHASVPRTVFDWLREISPCLDLPLNKIEDATRGRAEFWRLVESIAATPVHLSQLIALPLEERAVFGFCSDDEWAVLERTSGALQRIQRLRHDD